MGLDEYANMCDCYRRRAVMCRDCHNKQMNEQESRDQVTPLKYQLKEWRTLLKHLPPTDCDRDEARAVSNLITDLQAQVAECHKTNNELIDARCAEIAALKVAHKAEIEDTQELTFEMVRNFSPKTTMGEYLESLAEFRKKSRSSDILVGDHAVMHDDETLKEIFEELN